jgi:hypothetical protein
MLRKALHEAELKAANLLIEKHTLKQRHKERYEKLHVAYHALWRQLGRARYDSDEEMEDGESSDDEEWHEAEMPSPKGELQLSASLASGAVLAVTPVKLPKTESLPFPHHPPLGAIPVPEPLHNPPGAFFATPFGFVACDCQAAAGTNGCVISGACASMLAQEHACASNPDPGGGGYNDDDDERSVVRSLL